MVWKMSTLFSYATYCIFSFFVHLYVEKNVWWDDAFPLKTALAPLKEKSTLVGSTYAGWKKSIVYTYWY
jgi:hypothetical protein